MWVVDSPSFKINAVYQCKLGVCQCEVHCSAETEVFWLRCYCTLSGIKEQINMQSPPRKPQKKLNQSGPGLKPC